MYDNGVGVYLKSVEVVNQESPPKEPPKEPPLAPPPIRPQEIPVTKAAPPAPSVPLREAPGKGVPPEPPPHKK